MVLKITYKKLKESIKKLLRRGISEDIFMYIKIVYNISELTLVPKTSSKLKYTSEELGNIPFSFFCRRTNWSKCI